MTEENLLLTLSLDASPDGDDVERSRLTQQLRRQLLELDVEQVELVRDGRTPTGSKSAEAVTIGALLVTLAPTALTGAISLVQTWLDRHATSSIEISLPGKSITLTGGSSVDTQRLLDAFLAPTQAPDESPGG